MDKRNYVYPAIKNGYFFETIAQKMVKQFFFYQNNFYPVVLCLESKLPKAYSHPIQQLQFIEQKLVTIFQPTIKLTILEFLKILRDTFKYCRRQRYI